MKVKLFAVGLLAVLMVSIAGPSFAGRAHAAAPATVVTSVRVASAPSARPEFFNRSRFVIDMGIAFFAIHHVYKRYTQGYYASGSSHRITHLVTAGATLLIAYHFLGNALKNANSSNSKTLHALVSPINNLLTKTHNIGSTLQGAKSDSDVPTSSLDSSMQGLNSQTSQLGTQASSNGVNIKDISTPLPAGA